MIVPSDVVAHSAAEFLEQLFIFSLQHTISDIHFEPKEKNLQIRIRKDGLLSLYPSPSPTLSSSIIARLKVLASLDIGEKRLPQEGELSYPLSATTFLQARVSTCPTLYGEKIVLRLFHRMAEELSLAALGLEKSQLACLEQALRQPQGLILVTGPTGSGKSTTLYSALQYLNQGDLNIMTAEDPIEIKIPGISQVAIKPHLGFTFAQALRTFLRQDPDIIMIGEIRDAETAKIALQAAQTGHLVLATLHTNDSLHTLARLLLLHDDAALIADTLRLVIAQRLVRAICTPCLEQQCDCRDGYKERFPLFEMLPLSATLKILLQRQAAYPDLYQHALTEGFIPLRQAGLHQVAQGRTSLAEIDRVLGTSG